MMAPTPSHLAARLGRVEPGLRRALVAAYGVDAGREAAAEAVAWALENAVKLAEIENLGGYLYRVGQTAARKQRHNEVPLDAWPEPSIAKPVEVEPALQVALAELSARQREVVLMIHGYQYTPTETAAVLGCSVSTIRVHLERAMKALRSHLEVTSEL